MRLNITWSDQARAGLRAIDRDAALRILHAIDRFARTGEGDVKALQGPLNGFRRLRVGDYRIRFIDLPSHGIHVLEVENRREAYR